MSTGFAWKRMQLVIMLEVQHLGLLGPYRPSAKVACKKKKKGSNE